MKISIYGTEYTCDNAVKSADSVVLTNAAYRDMLGKSAVSETVTFSGISDFSGFEVLEGEYTIPPQSDADKIADIENAIAEIAYGGAL